MEFMISMRPGSHRILVKVMEGHGKSWKSNMLSKNKKAKTYEI